MTSDEARLFLGFKGNDIEPEDAYLDRIHEYKQQFVQQVPFKKLYVSRWKKMEKIEHAFSILTDVPFITFEIKEVAINRYDIKQDLNDLFVRFFKDVNAIKRSIYASNSVRELLLATTHYYEQYYEFAKLFKGLSTSENVKLSQAPDEMDLLAELTELSKKGSVKLEDLDLNNDNSAVVRELNRLSLWFKKENDDRTI